MQTSIKLKFLSGIRCRMQVMFLSIICLFAFVDPSIARDVISDCSKTNGLGFKKCSDHKFLESLFTLKSLKHKNYDEVRDAIRCLNKQEGNKTYFAPQDCGKMYDKFVKDVTITFNEIGWLKKSYDFRDISFKVIGGRDVFNDLITYLKDLDGFSLVKVDAKNLVSCKKRKIWEGKVYEYVRRDLDIDYSSCEGSAIECIMKEKAKSDWNAEELTPSGLDCSAKGFFQDELGSVEGSLFINYLELDEFNFKNTIISYHPSKVSGD